MHIIYNILFILAGYKWGDWREWRKYYPTILYFILCDLFANFLIYHYPLWSYQETIFGMDFLSNHTSISLMIMFIAYPVTILIYLGKFPEENWKKFLWMAYWVFIYSTIEFINLEYLNLITHNNGWSMYWSIAFNIVMFTTLRIHHLRPTLAWIISLAWAIFIIIMLDVPYETMK
ncbi:CBO0543 family protein [Ornithinibacillus xuwenensis]|uniref:CBO0543 family protein n=1 Tax=Ornithinibacillus xuwenensis TaxID=3144668 RepID=A0ABU9XH23_9BACI